MNKAIVTIACAVALSLPTFALAQLGGGKPKANTAVAPSETSQTTNCTVGAVDTKKDTFDCANTSGTMTFSVGLATVFQLTGGGSMFSDLKTDMAVQVTSHRSGNTVVADSVTSAP